jgi:hypothetical protein
MSQPARTHVVERGPRTAADWENAVHWYARLSEVDLAPEIVGEAENRLVVRCYEPLPDWYATHGAGARAEMGVRLLARVEELHGYGVCHRDLHVGNVVVRDGVPLLIDTEFAIAADPAAPCYDLVGPDRSGVPVPQRHAEQPNANRHGVWWDADNPEVTTLGRAFGLVADLRPPAE